MDIKDFQVLKPKYPYLMPRVLFFPNQGAFLTLTDLSRLRIFVKFIEALLRLWLSSGLSTFPHINLRGCCDLFI